MFNLSLATGSGTTTTGFDTSTTGFGTSTTWSGTTTTQGGGNNATIHVEDVRHVRISQFDDDSCCGGLELFHNGSLAESFELFRSFFWLSLS